MTHKHPRTVGDLIAVLSGYDPDTCCGSPPNPATRWSTFSRGWCAPPTMPSRGASGPPTRPWCGSAPVSKSVTCPQIATDVLRWSA